jgi:ABC-type lipoprotein export system ATPase subunit
VLADEPTGELDLESADAVYELLATAVKNAGASLILVTHDRRAGAIADRVVRIRDGRISETWSPATDVAGSDAAPESLVVDDRGWIRLPQEVRDHLSLGAELSVQVRDGELVLRPALAPPLPGMATPNLAGHELGNEVAAERNPSASLAAHDPGDGVDTGPGRGSNSGTGPGDERGHAIVQASGVIVSYQDRIVLGSESGGVDVSISTGELVVVAGRSGAGKSTLLRVLLGLQRPDAGQVRLDGVEIRGRDRIELARLRAGCCAVVMQHVHLASTVDAIGNLELARAARELPPDPMFVAAQLDRLGLTGLAHRQVAGLSGGERQRLAVARALATAPALIVLDEPTSQLDEVSAQMMATELRALADSGTAVLAATHDPVLIDVATRAYNRT